MLSAELFERTYDEDVSEWIKIVSLSLFCFQYLLRVLMRIKLN